MARDDGRTERPVAWRGGSGGGGGVVSKGSGGRYGEAKAAARPVSVSLESRRAVVVRGSASVVMSER